LDISMPTLGGIEAAVRIRWAAPKARIVFLSQHNYKAVVDAALATGAHGYVTKSTAGFDLIHAIRAILDGEKFVSRLYVWYPTKPFSMMVHGLYPGRPHSQALQPTHCCGWPARIQCPRRRTSLRTDQTHRACTG